MFILSIKNKSILAYKKGSLWKALDDPNQSVACARSLLFIFA